MCSAGIGMLCQASPLCALTLSHPGFSPLTRQPLPNSILYEPGISNEIVSLKASHNATEVNQWYEFYPLPVGERNVYKWMEAIKHVHVGGSALCIMCVVRAKDRESDIPKATWMEGKERLGVVTQFGSLSEFTCLLAGA